MIINRIISTCYIIIATIISLVLALSGNAYSQTSFAMFPMEKRGSIKPEIVEEAQGRLNQILIESKKYLIVDRQRTGTILQEQAFQISGVTDQNTIIKLGKIFNVDKFIHTILYQKTGNQFALRCSVIDVTTGQTEMTKEISRQNYTPTNLGSDCAGEIISTYPLMGKIEGITKDIFVANLGKKHGLNNGDRLFVARKKVVAGDDGKILFQELVRIGTIEVTSADEAWSKTKITKLAHSEVTIFKDDLVSPSPIPKNETLISNVPLLPKIKKSKILLEDDMKKNQYLFVELNEGDSYRRGKLKMTSSLTSSNPARCFYPPPFNELQNFIIEGEMEFDKVIERGNNCFKFYFRSNNRQGKQFRGYVLLFNAYGQYAVSIQEVAKEYYIVPFTSTPYLNRGESENKFKIVAYDSKFDIYVNDKYLVSFEDEQGSQGTVGLMARQGTSTTVSNITIWQAEKE
jgi:hypothetical protein